MAADWEMDFIPHGRVLPEDRNLVMEWEEQPAGEWNERRKNYIHWDFLKERELTKWDNLSMT